MKHLIGIDIGASHMTTGLFDSDRTLLHTHSLPLAPPVSPDDLIAKIKASVYFCLKAKNLCAGDILKVGIALPGTVDPGLGVILQACNLSVASYPLSEALSGYFSAPVFVENDANCAALAEYHLGAAQSAKSLVLVAVGTGIGGGILLDGKLMYGCRFGAGEVGHMVIVEGGHPCHCGRKGCFETYASASALVAMTKEAMKQNPDSLLWKLCCGQPHNATGKTAFEGKRLGDRAATEVVETYLSYLACGIGNIINILEPEVLCIGGGISREGDHLLIPLIEILCSSMWNKNPVPFYTRLICSKFANEAAMTGATLLGEEFNG